MGPRHQDPALAYRYCGRYLDHRGPDPYGRRTRLADRDLIPLHHHVPRLPA